MMTPPLHRRSATVAVYVYVFGMALGVASGLACSSDADPYNRLTTLRVLAVRSEPAVPAPGETATLSALVYTPPADPQAPAGSGLDPTLSYAWSWCPFPGPAAQGYPCLVTSAEVQMVTAGTAPDFDLGSGPTAALPHTIDPGLLERNLCLGMGGQPPLDCTGGVPVQIKLVTKTDSYPKGVTTVYTMRLGLLGTDANANPAISELAALQPSDGGGSSLPVDATNSQAVTLIRDVENPLRLDPSLPDQSETYLGTDDSGAPAMVRERLFVTWFVETGDTKDPSTGLIVGSSDPQVFLDNTWTPAVVKKYPRTTARIVLVIRDNRAGVGWFEGLVNLAEATP